MKLWHDDVGEEWRFWKLKDEHGCWGLRWQRAPPIVVRSAWAEDSYHLIIHFEARMTYAYLSLQVSTGPRCPSKDWGILGQDTIKIYEQMLDSNMQHLDCGEIMPKGKFRSVLFLRFLNTAYCGRTQPIYPWRSMGTHMTTHTWGTVVRILLKVVSYWILALAVTSTGVSCMKESIGSLH
jgi:hypothetical protein